MDSAPHEEWPVSRLAQVSGTSEVYFARSFRDAFGVPPHRYLLTRRVERAAATEGQSAASPRKTAGWPKERMVSRNMVRSTS